MANKVWQQISYWDSVHAEEAILQHQAEWIDKVHKGIDEDDGEKNIEKVEKSKKDFEN